MKDHDNQAWPDWCVASYWVGTSGNYLIPRVKKKGYSTTPSDNNDERIILQHRTSQIRPFFVSLKLHHIHKRGLSDLFLHYHVPYTPSIRVFLVGEFRKKSQAVLCLVTVPAEYEHLIWLMITKTNLDYTHIGPETVLRLRTEQILAGILLLSAVPTRVAFRCGWSLAPEGTQKDNSHQSHGFFSHELPHLRQPFRSGTRKRVGKEKIDIIMHRDHFSCAAAGVN